MKNKYTKVLVVTCITFISSILLLSFGLDAILKSQNIGLTYPSILIFLACYAFIFGGFSSNAYQSVLAFELIEYVKNTYQRIVDGQWIAIVNRQQRFAKEKMISLLVIVASIVLGLVNPWFYIFGFLLIPIVLTFYVYDYCVIRMVNQVAWHKQ